MVAARQMIGAAAAAAEVDDDTVPVLTLESVHDAQGVVRARIAFEAVEQYEQWRIGNRGWWLL